MICEYRGKRKDFMDSRINTENIGYCFKTTIIDSQKLTHSFLFIYRVLRRANTIPLADSVHQCH
jgi:hypothetical protein